MEIDILHKLALGAAAVLGVAVAVIKLKQEARALERQHLKAELELLRDHETHASDDPQYRGFLADLRKEKLSSLMFGCSVPNEELGRLMRYYEGGRATAQEIGAAWQYRTKPADSLGFDLSTFQKVQLAMIHIYGIGCLALSTLCWLLISAAPLDAWTIKLEFVAHSCVFAVLALVWYRSNRDLIIANRLSRRDRCWSSGSGLSDRKLNCGAEINSAAVALSDP